MYTANDFNFGIGSSMQPVNGQANYGIPVSSSGASNPVNSYLQMNTPAAATSGSAPAMGNGLGFNLDTGKLALGGLQTIGSLWQAFEANKLAKEQFNFQKEFANTNLANSIQSYNTTLEDRGRARAFTEGQTSEQAQAYIDKNRLPAATIR